MFKKLFVVSIVLCYVAAYYQDDVSSVIQDVREDNQYMRAQFWVDIVNDTIDTKRIGCDCDCDEN